MALTQRRQELLASDRWRALGAFVERWYSRPLDDEDGHSPLEIEKVAHRLDKPLPAALREWFELVGRRLRDVQDSPVLLDDLAIADGAACVWTENQGVWMISAPVDAGDDPPCLIDDRECAVPDGPLSHVLFSMLVSDTIVGAWSGARIGVLGELAPAVSGGYIDTFTDEQVQRARSRYATLPISCNPFFVDPFVGDSATLIRMQDVAIEWMTASTEAFATLDGVLGLMPEGGDHEVVAAFDASLTEAQHRYLTYEHEQGFRLPNTELFAKVLDGVGHVGIAVGGSAPRLHIRTKQPRRVLDKLVAALPENLLPHLTVATRPIAISVFEVLYPPGTTTYVLPD